MKRYGIALFLSIMTLNAQDTPTEPEQPSPLSPETWDNALGLAFSGYDQLQPSLSDADIDQLLGAGGLGMNTSDPTTFGQIKNFYSFFETLVKYEKGDSQQQSTILGALRGLKIAALKKQDPNETNPTQWDDQTTTLLSTLNTTLSTITITKEDFIQSDFWQNYLKYTITDLFDQMNQRADSANAFQLALYKYLPDLDVSIHQTDARSTWYAVDFLRHYFALVNIIIKRFALQCNDWSENSNNLKDLYETNVQPFKETIFYQAVLNPEQYTTDLDTTDDTDINKLQELGPVLSKHVTGISMVISLQNKLNALFTKDTLEETMGALRTANINASIIPYTADDYIYLSAMSDTQKSIAKVSDQTTEGVTLQESEDEDLLLSSLSATYYSSSNKDEKVVTQSWISDLGESLLEAGTEMVEGVENLGEDVVNTVASGLEGIAKGSVGLFTGNQALMEEASAAFGDAKNGLLNIVDDVGDVASGAVHGVGTTVGSIIGFADPKLKEDLTNAINAFGDTIIEGLELVAGGAVVGVTTAFRLAVDAVEIVATFVVGGVKVALGQETVEEWGAQFEAIAKDMAVAVIDAITFVVGELGEILMGLIEFIAYFTSTIVDLIIDTVRAYETIIEIAQGHNIVDAWERAKNSDSVTWMENHRRLLFNIVLGAEFIAITLLLGGGPIALGLFLAMDTAFLVFGAIGGYEEDEAALERKDQQHQFVQNYETFLNNTEKNTTHLQDVMADELSKKYASQINNMERSLGFYQSFLANRYQTTSGQLAENLKAYNVALLTPNERGAITADVGSIYGFKTNWLDFNPGQGFATYTKGRNTYSQEIAVSPGTIEPASEDETAPSRFWFLQKITKSVENLNEVEVRWQAIYVLNSFYIGLYLGGIPYETLEELQSKTEAEINHAHQAKMFVYKKESPANPAMLGVYEHESDLSSFSENNYWTPSTIPGPLFKVGSWYRMKTQLNGSTLNIKVWEEGTVEPGWTAITVTPSDETTLGIIYSGASVEFDIITPNGSVEEIPAVRGTDREPDEQERELSVRKEREQVREPVFGSFSLETIGYEYLLKDVFIYQTQDTGLTDIESAPANDYMVFGTSVGTTFSSIGQSPLSANCAISLVTGKAYDTSNNVIGNISNVRNAYESVYGKLDDTLVNNITEVQDAYITTHQGPYLFGNFENKFELTASSMDDLRNNVFIYKTTTPDVQGVTSNGQAIQDYVIMSRLDTQSYPSTYGMPFDASDSSVNGIISFVTGKVYNTAESTSSISGYSYLLDSYSTTLQQDIQNAQQAYQQSQTIPPAEPPAQQPASEITPADDSSVQDPPQSDFGSGSSNFGLLGAPDQSLNEQQQEAAGEESTSSGVEL